MLNKGEIELPQFPLKCELSLKENHAETLERLLTKAMEVSQSRVTISKYNSIVTLCFLQSCNKLPS